MSNKKTENINIKIDLDINKIPEKIQWSASENNTKDKEAKAMFFSIWDNLKKETLKIDLWTKDMPLYEMRIFFYQTLLSMSKTYYRATQDEKMRDTMQDFCKYFAEKLELEK